MSFKVCSLFVKFAVDNFYWKTYENSQIFWYQRFTVLVSINIRKFQIDTQNGFYTGNKNFTTGGTILYPTDTIWGIGCDATNIDAIKKIFDIKREQNKSLIILVETEKRLQDIVDVPEIAWQIMDVSEKPKNHRLWKSEEST